MRTISFLIIILLATCLNSSCSNYVKNAHSEMTDDHNDRNPTVYKRNKNAIRNQFTSYKKRNRKKSRLNPRIKKLYRPVKKRYKADDLDDNEASGSLWSGRGQENFLFANNRVRKSGDIVTILVQDALKKEITLELKRAFPPKKRKKKKKKKKKGEDKGAAPATAAAPAKTMEGDSEKVVDKISSIIVEEVNKDHLLIKGRKDVLYKKLKRTVEVEALVARRDVSDNDTIMSTNVLETNVNILR